MRRIFLLFGTVVLLQLSVVFAQTIDDYVLEHRGDTLVVKDDNDFGAPDALSLLMNADSTAPAGRVYVLKNFGYYSIVNNPTSSSTKKVVVMGESNESVKTRKDAAAPPILCGAVYEGGTTTGGINSGFDLLVKNANVSIGNSAGGIGWGFFGLAGPGLRLQVDNCIIEHNLWTVVGAPPAESRLFFTNNYFVNLLGHTCRRNGGVLDFFSNQDTIWVENNTHVNVQGLLYKSRDNYRINRQVYNHNNFINCSAFVLMNRGGHANYSVTNNIFVNTHIQGFSSVLVGADAGEVDPEGLPMGIVNVYADSSFLANGANFYVDKNLIYWDPTFNDVIQTLNANQVNGKTDWVSQMIPMNSRTQAMFDDNTTYPLLTEGDWFNKLPNFADTKDLFTTQLAILKEFSIGTVDTTYTGSLTAWRQAGNEEADYFTYADWPIPVDLSYTDADLLTAALGGFPVGDLTWFPAKYTQWEAQKDAEHAAIHNTLMTGVVGIEELGGLPVEFRLEQNYPNPFNPTTNISYSIPEAANVSLKVYNSLGQEVVTLVNGYQTAQSYNVAFNASDLASGVYFYTLKVDNFTQSKKMILIK